MPLLLSLPRFRRRQRRGITLIWILVALPALLLLLILLVEIGHLWLQRQSLELALEANSLAAVKEWTEDFKALDTQQSRIVGNSFSTANRVGDLQVDLGSAALNPAFDGQLNYDAGSINGNDAVTNIDWASFNPQGVLVFGSIIQFAGATPADPDVVFDANQAPILSRSGSLMVDVSGTNAADDENDWGISFRTDSDPIVNQLLRLERVVIDVNPDGTNTATFANFDASNLAVVSSGGAPKVEKGPDVQQDNVGWDDSVPTSQISFALLSPSQLEISFSADGSDDGFAPGDRFRFGARVIDPGQLDGDAIGDLSPEVTAFFSYNGVPQPDPLVDRMASYTGGGRCANMVTNFVDDLGQTHVVVHPLGVVDLPCAPTAAPVNSGQAFVEMAGSVGSLAWPAVRAQAEIQVPSVVGSIGPFTLGPWTIRAKANAYYDLDESEPKLIRIDQFLPLEP